MAAVYIYYNTLHTVFLLYILRCLNESDCRHRYRIASGRRAPRQTSSSLPPRRNPWDFTLLLLLPYPYTVPAVYVYILTYNTSPVLFVTRRRRLNHPPPISTQCIYHGVFACLHVCACVGVWLCVCERQHYNCVRTISCV